jgi:NADPH-dependent 2,4-dienoyl-CoA reductase/sulfur reductase-like enzyme
MAAGGLGLLATPGVWAADAPVLFPVPNNTGITGNVVVVGGGMSGAAVAKYLRLWGGTGVNVTLIEMSPSYTSNIMSNTVLSGQRPLSSLEYTYATLTGHYGVKRITSEVTSIDSANKRVYFEGGDIGYHRLVLAPGLEFDKMPGMDNVSQYDTDIPHAWKAGPQTALLRSQLVALTPGQNVVLTIPLAPYRCPPGPYERVCVIADWLKANKPGSKIIVLDANLDIVVEKDNFSRAFTTLYAGIVDYRPGSKVTKVDVGARAVTYLDGVGAEWTENAGVINAIPPQRAPKLLADAGLLSADSTKPFAPVDVLSYESTNNSKSHIHVIGDASLTTQPKAGHIGNQQGKTCADAIVRLLAGKPLDRQVVTNSACYTPITLTTATWLSAVYQYDGVGKMVVPSWHIPALGAPAGAIAATAATTENYQDMLVWFRTLMGDTFS